MTGIFAGLHKALNVLDFGLRKTAPGWNLTLAPRTLPSKGGLFSELQPNLLWCNPILGLLVVLGLPVLRGRA